MGKSLAIIGAGPAGCFAAIKAKQDNPDLSVVILESSQRALTKVKISGGGRCNVTHNCFDIAELVKAYPRGNKELKSAFSRFQPQNTIEWFEGKGVPLKTESDGRMFPTTDNSQTIIDCLLGELDKLNVEIKYGQRVSEVSNEDGLFTITFANDTTHVYNGLIIATGSAPEGHTLAQRLGHGIIYPVPSLFTFKIRDPLIEGLQGIAFSECLVKLKMESTDKKFTQTGPVLITHWGLSGPAILKLSAFAARELYNSHYQAELQVNWLNKDSETVYKGLTELKKEFPQRLIKTNPFSESIVKRFWENLLSSLDIPLEKLMGEVSGKDLRAIANELTIKSLTVVGKGVFKEEFVTCGGVDLKEIDFKSMESKLVPHLYFCGEVLNIDGITGGFNFQNAWSGGWLAGQAAALL